MPHYPSAIAIAHRPLPIDDGSAIADYPITAAFAKASASLAVARAEAGLPDDLLALLVEDERRRLLRYQVLELTPVLVL